METSVVIMQHGENLVSQAIRALPRAAPGKPGELQCR
jgi:hypothetical protein